MIGKRFQFYATSKIQREQAKSLRMLEISQQVHLLFWIVGTGFHFYVQITLKKRPVGQFLFLWSDQFIE